MKNLLHQYACLEDKLTALNVLLDETQKASKISSVKYYEKAVKNFKCKEEDEPSGTKEEKAKGVEAATATKRLKSCKEHKSSGPSSQNQEVTEAQCAPMDFREGRLLLYSMASPASKRLSFQV